MTDRMADEIREYILKGTNKKNVERLRERFKVYLMHDAERLRDCFLQLHSFKETDSSDAIYSVLSKHCEHTVFACSNEQLGHFFKDHNKYLETLKLPTTRQEFTNALKDLVCVPAFQDYLLTMQAETRPVQYMAANHNDNLSGEHIDASNLPDAPDRATLDAMYEQIHLAKQLIMSALAQCMEDFGDAELMRFFIIDVVLPAITGYVLKHQWVVADSVATPLVPPHADFQLRDVNDIDVTSKVHQAIFVAVQKLNLESRDSSVLMGNATKLVNVEPLVIEHMQRASTHVHAVMHGLARATGIFGHHFANVVAQLLTNTALGPVFALPISMIDLADLVDTLVERGLFDAVHVGRLSELLACASMLVAVGGRTRVTKREAMHGNVNGRDIAERGISMAAAASLIARVMRKEAGVNETELSHAYKSTAEREEDEDDSVDTGGDPICIARQLHDALKNDKVGERVVELLCAVPADVEFVKQFVIGDALKRVVGADGDAAREYAGRLRATDSSSVLKVLRLSPEILEAFGHIESHDAVDSAAWLQRVLASFEGDAGADARNDRPPLVGVGVGITTAHVRDFLAIVIRNASQRGSGDVLLDLLLSLVDRLRNGNDGKRAGNRVALPPFSVPTLQFAAGVLLGSGAAVTRTPTAERSLQLLTDFVLRMKELGSEQQQSCHAVRPVATTDYKAYAIRIDKGGGVAGSVQSKRLHDGTPLAAPSAPVAVTDLAQVRRMAQLLGMAHAVLRRLGLDRLVDATDIDCDNVTHTMSWGQPSRTLSLVPLLQSDGFLPVWASALPGYGSKGWSPTGVLFALFGFGPFSTTVWRNEDGSPKTGGNARVDLWVNTGCQYDAHRGVHVSRRRLVSGVRLLSGLVRGLAAFRTQNWAAWKDTTLSHIYLSQNQAQQSESAVKASSDTYVSRTGGAAGRRHRKEAMAQEKHDASADMRESAAEGAAATTAAKATRPAGALLAEISDRLKTLWHVSLRMGERIREGSFFAMDMGVSHPYAALHVNPDVMSGDIVLPHEQMMPLNDAVTRGEATPARKRDERGNVLLIGAEQHRGARDGPAVEMRTTLRNSVFNGAETLSAIDSMTPDDISRAEKRNAEVNDAADRRRTFDAQGVHGDAAAAASAEDAANIIHSQTGYKSPKGSTWPPRDAIEIHPDKVDSNASIERHIVQPQRGRSRSSSNRRDNALKKDWRAVTLTGKRSRSLSAAAKASADKVAAEEAAAKEAHDAKAKKPDEKAAQDGPASARRLPSASSAALATSRRAFRWAALPTGR
jgi:hypothetical protein